MAFPSTLTTFTRPNATDKLSSPSHSSIHTALSSTVGQIEAVIGTDASTLGTIIGDLRSASSDGGGHVQSAAKGGTGQTTFTKGDLLVAQNSSTVSKLGVGSNTQTLEADSTTAAGIKWVDSKTNRIHASVLSSVTGQGVVAEGSVFSVTIPGSTLGTGNAIRATLSANIDFADPTASVLVRGNYGGGAVTSVLLQATDQTGFQGTLEYKLFANGAVGTQEGELFVHALRNDSNVSSVLSSSEFDFGTSSVHSDADQTLGLTWRASTADSNNALRPRGLIIEKIT